MLSSQQPFEDGDDHIRIDDSEDEEKDGENGD